MNDKTYGIFNTEANKKIIEKFDDVIIFPPVEIERIDFDVNILNNFDWLVFPDIFSVESFLQTLEINNFELFELDELRVCACGEAISDRLRFQQLHADVIPQKNNDENVLQAIIDYENPSDLNFLITKKDTNLAEMLRENGAEVSEIETYKEKEIPNFAKLKSLLKGGAIDEFIFTSPEDVFSLSCYSKLDELEILFSVIEDNAYQILREFGVKPIFYKKNEAKK